VLLLVSVLAAGIGVFVAVRGGSDAIDAIEDAVDSAGSTGFDGRRVDGDPISPGTTAEQTLDDDEVGAHAIEGIEGRITISVAGEDDFDPVLRLVDAGGRVLGEDDDSGGSLDSRLSVTLPGGPGVTALVREFGGDAGSYVVSVQRGDDEVGIAPTEGAALALGAPVTGVVAADATVAHLFTGVGRTVRITVEGIDGFDPVVRVRAAGIVLGENDDTNGTDAQLDVAIPEGQEAVVEVFGFAGRGGTYRVLVQ
jgi:hypothetical protein